LGYGLVKIRNGDKLFFKNFERPTPAFVLPSFGFAQFYRISDDVPSKKCRKKPPVLAAFLGGVKARHPGIDSGRR
jgi:hypothetical protein